MIFVAPPTVTLKDPGVQMNLYYIKGVIIWAHTICKQLYLHDINVHMWDRLDVKFLHPFITHQAWPHLKSLKGQICHSQVHKLWLTADSGGQLDHLNHNKLSVSLQVGGLSVAPTKYYYICIWITRCFQYYINCLLLCKSTRILQSTRKLLQRAPGATWYVTDPMGYSNQNRPGTIFQTSKTKQFTTS